MCAECLLLQCICSRLAGFKNIAETNDEKGGRRGKRNNLSSAPKRKSGFSSDNSLAIKISTHVKLSKCRKHKNTISLISNINVKTKPD